MSVAKVFRWALGLSALGSVCAYNLAPEPGAFVQPLGWPAPVYRFANNPGTAAGRELGRMLFYEPALSRDSSISCASCHAPAMAFTHADHRVSHGMAGRLGSRNAPGLFNLAWNTSFHWDGGVNHLETQAVNPLTHPNEMDASLPQLLVRLNASPAYRARFYRAFADSVVTTPRLLKALAQFTVSLESSNSKYDKYVRHEPGGEFTDQELSGLTLFRANCASCHREPLFTNNGFANNGLPVDSLYNDLGRAAITGRPADRYQFRVPTLRNIELTSPYMHDGRFQRLREVLRHYTTGIQPGPTLAPELQQPLLLSPNQQKDILAFLLTLTDRDFVNNPAYQYQPND
ncbi:cytochrome-c peroxidase [Hymenobacter artigasi]|uniref:Cytochrome c peroxidase n=1 Tax=Hymenobacter artigasi TaxID=2719616 RepID=A0ABX1HRT0_9BACT|nr:cytochrome c peroxidase [Hymenobacter artigasi]NKI91956.1 cytochrome c peroxidase [Hymenobacter artigasi]